MRHPNNLTEITFSLIVDQSPNAVLLANEEGKIAYVNRQCELLFGYETSELLGQTVDILVSKNVSKKHSEHRRKFFRNPSMRKMDSRELTGRRKDGSEFPVEVGLNPLVLVDGTWALATILDISARKAAEERFRRVVQNAPTAMMLVDREGRINLVNQAAVVLFGYAENELSGNNIDKLVPDYVRPRHPMLREQFFSTPQTRNMGVGRDLVGRRKDGSVIPVEIGLNPIQTESGLMVLASVVDITARKTQEELKERTSVAEAAYKAKGELLAVASHDLKNPLSAIAGLAEILLEMKRAEPSPSQQDIEYLQSIYDASHHMSEVVKGILATEGLEQQGEKALHKEDVDLGKLCEKLIQMNDQNAKKKNIRLLSDIVPGIVINADKTRLEEAFDNYINNAVKYSSSDKSVTVSLTALPDRKEVEFGVRDEGPGLSKEDMAKVFGKFTKLSARPTGGESSTGLGLAIVKTIVELHHGTVGCESEQGHGAYFWVRLPA
jgi:PAS domain S-box-containing protein